MAIKINADNSTGLEITSDTSTNIDFQSNDVTKMSIGSTIDIQGNELVLDADADTSIHASTDDQIDFKTGGTDRMRIDSSGILLVGTSSLIDSTKNSIGQFANVNGGRPALALGNLSGSTETNVVIFKNSNGEVGTINTSGSGTAYATSSDYRLKENVSYTFDATSRLKQLKPARFNFKADADTTLDGFLAHEVSSIVPEAVIGEKDGVQMQGIDQSKLVPLLVKTIQELEARITALESE
jgi:hypothetical protein